jgi:hypothetical protein
MPITTQISLNPLDQEAFARLDYQVMRQVFSAIQWVNLARQRVQLVSLIK